MGKVYTFLKQYMKKFPMTIAWRIKSHSRVVDKHLNDGEEVLYVFAGQKNDSWVNIFNTYVIVFTNKRIIVATKRVLFGYFFKSITPDMYNDLTIHRGLIWGSIILDTVKEVITITNIDINALDDIETNITEIMLKHKKEFGILMNSKSTKK
ncbi:MAG: PH domain-containing protein [Bacilli bacterium]|nr:PH domain-containing protein [Bacilli bacterium]